jgi:hypothetical protein
MRRSRSLGRTALHNAGSVGRTAFADYSPEKTVDSTMRGCAPMSSGCPATRDRRLTSMAAYLGDASEETEDEARRRIYSATPTIARA